MLKLKQAFRMLWSSWATRSLAIGAVATALDLSLGGILIVLSASTRVAAMSGTLVGSTFTFLANRHYAFREHNPKLVSPALRFALLTALSSVAHGQLVVMLRDGLHVPYVPAKMVSDLVVFTFAQLVLLRYVVFPQKKAALTKENNDDGEGEEAAVSAP